MKTFGLILFTLLVLPLPALADLCEKRAFSVRSAGYRVANVADRLLVTTGISRSLKPKEGKDPLSAYVRDPSIVGVESYSLALHRETTLLLQREITPEEISAIEQANHLKRGSSRPEGVNLRAKVQILKKAGFSKTEVRKLIENGIVWIRSLSAEEAHLKALKEDKEDIYFSSGLFLANPSQRTRVFKANKVVQETSEYFEVLAEVLTDNGVLTMETVRIRKSFVGDAIVDIRVLHPNTQVLFSVAESEKPKINREDIKLPPPTREEAKLKEKGFGPSWTKGLDKLNEWVAVRKQLQELRANPRTTHIPYFADQISAHLDFAKKGLGASISQQKEIGLANLVRTAKRAILEEKVTYEWWLKFNYQISSVLSDPSAFFSSQTSSPVQASLISHFPLQMAVPTTYGEVGIITLNRAQSEGIHPLGLINQTKKVDSQLHTPPDFISHDIVHMRLGLQLNSWRYSLGHILKHKEMLELIENGSTEKSKQAELVYFSLTHESMGRGAGEDIFFENQPREKMLNETANHFKKLLEREVFSLRMAGLGKEYTDLKSEEAQIQYIREHIAEPFMQEVYDPVF